MSLDIKRGDTWPPMVLHIMAGKDPLPLGSAAEIRVIIKKQGGSGIMLGPVAITDVGTSEVTYMWQPGDTNAAGTYRAEAEILWSNGSVQTVPAAGYEEIRINEDLGGVAPA